MKYLSNYLDKGAQFVRSNPQLLYTIFLLIAIPTAFVWTSQQFLGIAQTQNDKASQQRVGMLQDAFAAFLPTQTDDVALDKRIADISAQNETITGFFVTFVKNDDASTVYKTVASLKKNEVPLGDYQPDPATETLMGAAHIRSNEGQSLTMEITKSTMRQWRTVRMVPHPRDGYVAAFVVTDYSMAQSDAELSRKIFWAYGTLALVIALIVVLLGRQARIIDYATLYKRLEEVDHMKDDFVSMAAHELRSPLTTIRGYVDLIREVQHMSPQGEEMLAHVDRSAQDLNALIGDILDVSKLQEGRMSFQMASVDAIAETRDVVEAYKKPAADKGLSLEFVANLVGNIEVDKTRLHQILVNLVGNAVKYTKQGGVIVSTKEIPERNLVEIRVSDTGLGISSEAQEKLFTKFYRVKTPETAKITGTGLGLWITAEIVRQMHGTITVESIEGKGSDFIVRFPLSGK